MTQSISMMRAFKAASFDKEKGLYKVTRTGESGKFEAKWMTSEEYDRMCDEDEAQREKWHINSSRRLNSLAIRRQLAKREYDELMRLCCSESSKLSESDCNGVLVMTSNHGFSVTPAFISKAFYGYDVNPDMSSTFENIPGMSSRRHVESWRPSLIRFVWTPRDVLHEEIRFGGPADKIHWKIVKEDEVNTESGCFFTSKDIALKKITTVRDKCLEKLSSQLQNAKEGFERSFKQNEILLDELSSI